MTYLCLPLCCQLDERLLPEGFHVVAPLALDLETFLEAEDL